MERERLLKELRTELVEAHEILSHVIRGKRYDEEQEWQVLNSLAHTLHVIGYSLERTANIECHEGIDH